MDRIVAQVVDPKINHIFRPQVERVVREFLSPGSCSEEPPAPPPPTEPKQESSTTEQGICVFSLFHYIFGVDYNLNVLFDCKCEYLLFLN